MSNNANVLAQLSDRTISPVPSIALTDGDYGVTSRSRHSTLQRY